MKNIVLLGGSHSVMADGLQKGLRSGVLKLNEESTIFNFYNFAIGGCTSIQNLYEVVRHRHILNNADLIITESNINEIYNHYFIQNMPLKLIYRDLNWFYKELYFLNKKIIVIILAENIIKDGDKKNVAIINNIHRKLSYKFGFNIIDFDRYYFDKNLYHFSKLLEPGVHQCSIILRELGLSIMDNIKSFSKSKISSIKNDNPHFKIITPKNMKLIKGNIPSRIIHNAMYKEKVYRLNYFTKLQFPIELNGYFILGLHGWNNEMEEQIKHKGWNERIRTYSSIVIYNEHNMITKEVAFLNQFINLNNIIFVLKDENFLEINKDNSRIFSELCVNVETWHNDSIQIDFCDLIGFLLASPEGNYYTEEIDFEALANENIKIPEEYDFNHLIPPIELYKEIIDEYCSIMDPRKLASLQNRIKEKDDIISTLNSVKSRIQNQLSYKLGQTLILNSKSVLGYLSLPFIILSIVISHKQEQKAYKFKVKKNPNLALPPLETYPDYNEALKEKECFTYKLGEAFIKASKNWYKGGYIKFILKDVPRLKREFGKG